MRPSAAVMARRDQEFQQAGSRHEIDQLQKRWAAEDAAIELATTAAGQEVAALRRRLGRLERSLAPGGSRVEPLLSALGQVLATERAKFAAEVKSLGDRVKELEDVRVRFLGTHEVGRQYSPGALVVRQGSLWYCQTVTRTAPGTAAGAAGWQLCVKSGEAR